MKKKSIQKVVPKVLNVSLLLIIYGVISCKAVRNDLVDNTYKLEKFKSKQTDFSSIVVNAYDFENKKELAGIVYVNNVVFFMGFDENKKKGKALDNHTKYK